MSAEHEKLKEILVNAAALATPQGRASYLTAVCGDDSGLRAQVEGLLKAHDQAGDFLEQSVIPPLEEAMGEGPGSMIGRYKLLELIGEGGFGRVFMAEQTEPVHRRVALKIIKAGMDTREVIARFEAERQALALMDHPNIAKVLDAGATEAGRPYFVMELVNGIPITAYCDRAKLPMEARLRLFMKLCHAVQHAHQKAIIHRDLKPSNILVTVVDGEPVPKIIDFGVAKALGQQLTERTLFTAFQQVIGTPAYMSPEQAGLSGADIDTRSDIYSLGVLLYELLTGVTPLDTATLRQAALDEIRRMIRETEPPKPSTRLRTMGPQLNLVAQHRHTEPSALSRAVHGDLDWIVMKALEKDRARRYETAGALEQDLRHHLENEPVQAGPPGALYRMRKFIRRHRVGVGLAAAVTVVLVTGLAGSLIGLAQVKRARDQAMVAEARAQADAAIAEAVKEFLAKDLLGQASPWAQPDRDVKLRTLLDRAAEKVGTRFRDKPLVEAEIRLTLSWVYFGLGEYPNARTHFDRGLEIYQTLLSPDDPKMLKARLYEAVLLSCEGHEPESRQLLEQLLPNSRQTLGTEDPVTLGVMIALSEAFGQERRHAEAQAMGEEVMSLTRRVLGPEDGTTLWSMGTLAAIYSAQYKHDEAQKLMEDVVEIKRRISDPEDLDLLQSIARLAGIYRNQGKLTEAQGLYEQVIPGIQHALGSEHPSWSDCMTGLADTFSEQGKSAEAENLWEEVIAAHSAIRGPEDPGTLAAKCNLADAYRRQHKLAEAQERYEELLSIMRNDPGEKDPLTLRIMSNLGITYYEAHKLDKAQQILEEELELSKEVLEPGHLYTLLSTNNLASVYQDQGKFDLAENMFKQVISVSNASLGPEHPQTLIYRNNLAAVYWKKGQLEEAQKLQEEVFSVQRGVLPTDHPDTLYTMERLAGTYASQGKLEQARQLFVDVLAVKRLGQAAYRLTTEETVHALASLSGTMGDWPKAMEYYQELAAAGDKARDCVHRGYASAALLAGRPDIYQEQCAALLARHDNSQQMDSAQVTAIICLLAPDSWADLPACLRLADAAIENDPDGVWSRLSKGMAEYRGGNKQAACKWLEGLAGNPRAACVAQYLVALAYDGLGRSEDARTALAAANRRLDRLLRRGSMDPEFDGCYKWSQTASALVIRSEAERAILGAGVSPPVDAASLAAARKSWLTIRTCLQRGREFAQDAQWPDAAEAFAEALRLSAFDWRQYRDESPLGCLGLQMGIAFVRAGDVQNHERLCRLIIDSTLAGLTDPTVREAERFARLCFLNGKRLPADLREQGLKWARFAVANRGQDGLQAWASLAGGGAEYYAGDAERAVELLTGAEGATEVGCRGGAMVYRAMALKKIGRDAEAAELLQQADALLAEPLQGGSDEPWCDLEFCRMALEEARQSINQPPKP